MPESTDKNISNIEKSIEALLAEGKEKSRKQIEEQHAINLKGALQAQRKSSFKKRPAERKKNSFNQDGETPEQQAVDLQRALQDQRRQSGKEEADKEAEPADKGTLIPTEVGGKDRGQGMLEENIDEGERESELDKTINDSQTPNDTPQQKDDGITKANTDSQTQKEDTQKKQAEPWGNERNNEEVEREDQEDQSQNQKERSLPTQAVNRIRHRKQIGKIDANIRNENKTKKKLSSQRDALRRKNRLPLAKIKTLSGLINLLNVIICGGCFIGAILIVTIVLSGFGLAILPIMLGILKITYSLKGLKKREEEKIKTDLDDIKNKTKEIAEATKKIKKLEKERNNLKNASLL